MGEAHVHLFGEDLLLVRDGWEWVASVPGGAGASAQEVARAETFTDLVTQLTVRWRIDGREAA